MINLTKVFAKSAVVAGVSALAWLVAASTASAGTGTCAGAAPADSAVLRGPVLEVLDGRTLCVARGFDPTDWVKLEIQDAPDDMSRGALMAAAFSKNVDCRISSRDPEGPKAICRIAGHSIGDILRRPSVQRAAQTWR